MSCPYGPDEREALVAGELPTERALELERHAKQCPECGPELAALRAERAMFQRRAQAASPLQPELWAGVEQRLQPGKVVSLHAGFRRRTLWAGAAGLAMAAAMAWFMVGGPQLRSASSGRVRIAQAQTALDHAEEEYRNAAALLEAEYQAGRPRLPPDMAKHYDALLETSRSRLAQARTEAGRHLDARLKVLDGYRAYVRSLQEAVIEIPEATP